MNPVVKLPEQQLCYQMTYGPVIWTVGNGKESVGFGGGGSTVGWGACVGASVGVSEGEGDGVVDGLGDSDTNGVCGAHESSSGSVPEIKYSMYVILLVAQTL